MSFHRKNFASQCRKIFERPFGVLKNSRIQKKLDNWIHLICQEAWGVAKSASWPRSSTHVLVCLLNLDLGSSRWVYISKAAKTLVKSFRQKLSIRRTKSWLKIGEENWNLKSKVKQDISIVKKIQIFGFNQYSWPHSIYIGKPYHHLG